MGRPDGLAAMGLRHLGMDLDHCENVAWDPTTGTALAGGEAGQIYRIRLDGSVEETARIPGAFILGIAVDRDGSAFACDVRGGRIHRIARDGTSEPFGPALDNPNFPALAADGTLYVSQEGAHLGRNGAIIALDPAGSPTPVPLSRPLDFGNALLVEGDDLIVVESDGARVSRVARDGGDLTCLVELPGTVPDGLARDAEGGLWISCYQPNRIYRALPGTAPELVVEDVLGWELPMPTGICFAGANLETILVACLGGWSLAALDTGIPGRPTDRLAAAQGEAK